MISLATVRPLRPLVGTRLASFGGFLFSGILHELAISVPVKAGYGLPLLYFSIQAIAVEIEQLLKRHGFSIEKSAWIGRTWSATCLLLPLPLLFHFHFLRGIVFPLIGAEIVIP